MEHRFNVQFAKDYGIEEAILIDNLYYWVAKNVANERHKYEGRYWTYNSAKAFGELFPYMSETKIYRVLAHLEDLGVIIKGKFSQDKHDRTNWYTFSEMGLCALRDEKYDISNFCDTFQNDEMHFAKMKNGICKNEKCIIINNTDNKQQIEKEEKDIKISSKKDELFEECWVAYRRKGSKKKAKEQWGKLKDEDKNNVLPHIKAYVGSRDINYQKDFERYLRDRTFMDIIYKGHDVIFDPERNNGDVYMPTCGGALKWNDYYNCYLYIGFYSNGDTIYDGYNDDNRPNGATIVLNNARGTIVWSKELKQWVKQ